ncbi:MAG: ATP-binding protein [Candidatus Rokuibacteriota bacterium]
MITKNLAHAAVLAGYSVVFRTAAELIDDLQVDSPELRRRRLTHYGQPHLVCIDEVGYLSYDNHAADLLYEVVNRRYEVKSLIVTTNRAFKEWNQVVPNATCIATLLDRLHPLATPSPEAAPDPDRRRPQAPARSRTPARPTP